MDRRFLWTGDSCGQEIPVDRRFLWPEVLMEQSVALIVISVIVFALIPLAPKVLMLRIKLFRFLRWNWLAALHEKHFVGFILAARIILAGIAILLLTTGLRQL